MFYKFLCRLLHVMVDVWFTVCNYFGLSSLLSRILDYWSHWLLGRSQIHKQQQQQHIFKDDNEISRLKRLPKHLGLLIAEENVSYSDIANLVVWSMAMGITCISLYDHDGVIKKNREAFLNQVIATKQQVLGSASSRYSVELDSVLVNGCKPKERVVVNLLWHVDGKWNIAKAAQDICHSVGQGLIKSTDVDVDLLTDQLKLPHSTADPDLIVVFGSTLCTLGYLPWHIRLTEIFTLPSHHRVCYKDFHKIFYRFNLCEQRFGK